VNDVLFYCPFFFWVGGDAFSFGLVLYRLVIERSPLSDVAPWPLVKWLTVEERWPEFPRRVAPLHITVKRLEAMDWLKE
jgi:hypothetical protein